MARRGGRRRELKRRGVRRLGGVRLGGKRRRSVFRQRARFDPRRKSLFGGTRLPRGHPSTTRGRAFFALIRSTLIFFAARPEVERQIGERVHRGCRFFSLRRREGRKGTRVARSEPPETRVGGKFAVNGGVLAERRRRAERLGRRKGFRCRAAFVDICRELGRGRATSCSALRTSVAGAGPRTRGPLFWVEKVCDGWRLGRLRTRRRRRRRRHRRSRASRPSGVSRARARTRSARALRRERSRAEVELDGCRVSLHRRAGRRRKRHVETLGAGRDRGSVAAVPVALVGGGVQVFKISQGITGARGLGSSHARARAARHHHGRASGISRTEKPRSSAPGRPPAYRRALSEQRDRRDYLPVEAIVHPSVLLSPSSARLVPREGVRSTLRRKAPRGR